MAATTTIIFSAPTVRRSPSETSSGRHTDDGQTLEAAFAREFQGFGDTDYHLLRSQSLLERLEKAVAVRI